MSNPWAILPIACLFGMIDGSKSALSTMYGVDPSISDAIFGIIVYGAAIISIFYFLVPFRWFIRIFKGKTYADNYQHYVNHINQHADDASSIIYYLKEKSLGKISNDYFDQKLLNEKMKQFNIRTSGKLSKTKYRIYRNKIYQKYEQLKQYDKQIFLKNNKQSNKGG